MPGLPFKLTNAGRAALVNPDNTGTVARKVVSVGIAAAPFVHDDELTKVPNERATRLTTVAGETVANDTIHVSMTDDSADQYTMYGFGLYLDNGVLLGTYGQQTPILEKSPSAMMMLATDIVLTTVDAAALTFGDASFLNPPATTTVKGVVELADNTETQAGTDGTRAVTPAGLSARTATDARTGLVELATSTETQTGTDATRAVTPAGLSARTATESRTGLAEIATQAEVDQGADDARFVTAKKLLTRLKSLGLGTTDASAQIQDMDDATVASGLYYVPAVALAIPFALGAGVVLHRVYGNSGLQLFFPDRTNRPVFRRRIGGAWQPWAEIALLDSPAFTGTPTVPTAPKGTATAQAASTEFVMAAIADLVDSSPGALDTLKELAAALGNDPNFATTVVTELGKKFDKEGGVVGVQTSGWSPINSPTMRVVDGGNAQSANGPNGGFAIESYGPGIQLIDRSTGMRNALLMLDGNIVSVRFDQADTPGAYSSVFHFASDGYMSIGPLSSSALFRIGYTVPGGSAGQYGVYNNVEFNELCTNTGAAYIAIPRVKDAAFSMGTLVGFHANAPVVPAAASVGDYAGVYVADVTNPAIARSVSLRLRMTATAGKWNVFADGSAPNHFAGKVLIGTASDNGQLLQVNGSSTVTGRQYRGLSADLAVGATSIAGIQNAGPGNESYINTSRFSNDNQPGGINIGKSRGATVGTQGAVLAGDALGQVNFCGSDGAAINIAAQLEVIASENYTSTARGSHLDFRTTAQGSTTRVVKMRLSDSGELRIGSVTSDGSGAKLQVTGYATVDTPPDGDRSRKVATTEFVMRAISSASIGQVILEPRTTARAGCLLLNGALLKRADYPELWAYAQASGNLATEAEWMAGRWGSFSTGDGSTTFRIPEYRGEFLRMWDAGRGVDSGRYIGGYQAPMNMSHAHSASASAVGDHAHSAWTDAQGHHAHGGTASWIGDHQHGTAIGQNSGVGMPWGFYDTANNHPGVGSQDGDNSYPLSSPAGGHSHTIATDGQGSHGHNVGIGGAGAHSHTITVNADGGAEVRVRNVAVAAMIRAF